MAKITETEKIVLRKGEDITLEDGYDLVIKEDDVFKYYPEGTVPKKKKWLKTLLKDSPIEVYAVSTDNHHELAWKRAVSHGDNMHQFFVKIRLRFGVDDPLEVVRTLRRDPAEQLKDEAANAIIGFLRTSIWEDIRHPNRFQQLKKRALEAAIMTGRDGSLALFDRVTKHGKEYGLKLIELDFDVEISEKDLKVALTQEENKVAKLVSDSDTDRDIHVNLNEQQLTAQKNNFQRVEDIKDQLAQTAKNFVDRAGSNIAEGSRSIDDVRKVLASAREISNELQGGRGSNNLLGGGNSNTSSPPQLSAGKSALVSLQDILVQIKDLNLDTDTSRKVIGILFQMIGGKLLDQPNEDVIAYAQQLNGLDLPVDLQDYLKEKWIELRSRIDQNQIL